MTLYIDDDYKCHITNTGSLHEIETDFFNGKCSTYIEGYRFVPAGQTWTRNDGTVFQGEMITPFKDISMLNEIQSLHDEISKGQNAQNSQIAYIGMMTEVI